mmetsp:Transcript_12250/g.28992  ORF Transcript_12250/g.28992 Transcript_12250/m.28992 type:complete len:297 (-) Transcript_12250:486-1376(-)
MRKAQVRFRILQVPNPCIPRGGLHKKLNGQEASVHVVLREHLVGVQQVQSSAVSQELLHRVQVLLHPPQGWVEVQNHLLELVELVVSQAMVRHHVHKQALVRLLAEDELARLSQTPLPHQQADEGLGRAVFLLEAEQLVEGGGTQRPSTRKVHGERGSQRQSHWAGRHEAVRLPIFGPKVARAPQILRGGAAAAHAGQVHREFVVADVRCQVCLLFLLEDGIARLVSLCHHLPRLFGRRALLALAGLVFRRNGLPSQRLGLFRSFGCFSSHAHGVHLARMTDLVALTAKGHHVRQR